MQIMKLYRYTILSLIVVMLTAISFDISVPKLMDSTSETTVEISLEEKESKKTSDEKLIANVSDLYMKATKAYTGFDFSLPLVNQLYLNNIFKPPIFS